MTSCACISTVLWRVHVQSSKWRRDTQMLFCHAKDHWGS